MFDYIEIKKFYSSKIPLINLNGKPKCVRKFICDIELIAKCLQIKKQIRDN